VVQDSTQESLLNRGFEPGGAAGNFQLHLGQRTRATRVFDALTFGVETHPGEFTDFVNSLYASLAPGVLQAVEQELRAELPFARVTIDSDGDLAVSQPVMVRGGVTETYLRHMLGFWRATMARVEKSIEKHADAADRRTLN
jgi:hypothetical protein